MLHGIDRLRRFTAEAGHDPASVALAYRVKRYGEAVPPRASNGERRLFSGSDADFVADLRALQALGVGAVDIDFEGPDADASIAGFVVSAAAVLDARYVLSARSRLVSQSPLRNLIS